VQSTKVTEHPAITDAKAAIAEQDYVLWRVPVRGLQLPGIDLRQYAISYIAKHCEIRYLEHDLGDQLNTEADKQRLREQRDYARIFNRYMLPLCLEPQV
jgi:hypothetical protein